MDVKCNLSGVALEIEFMSNYNAWLGSIISFLRGDETGTSSVKQLDTSVLLFTFNCRSLFFSENITTLDCDMELHLKKL